jgi:hypothetical protein
MSILMTWIFLQTKGSLLISGLLFHAAVDTVGPLFLSGVDLSGIKGTKVLLLVTGVSWVAVMIVLAIFGPRLSGKPQTERTR